MKNGKVPPARGRRSRVHAGEREHFAKLILEHCWRVIVGQRDINGPRLPAVAEPRYFHREGRSLRLMSRWKTFNNAREGSGPRDRDRQREEERERESLRGKPFGKPPNTGKKANIVRNVRSTRAERSARVHAVEISSNLIRSCSANRFSWRYEFSFAHSRRATRQGTRRDSPATMRYQSRDAICN